MEPINYTIKQGDTLGAIAKANNTTVQDIQKANPTITDVNRISTGASLVLPKTLSPMPLVSADTQNVNLPTVPVTPVNTVQPNMADTLLQQTQVPEGKYTTTANDLSLKIANLIPELQGQTQALVEAQKQAGVDALKSDLQSINNQINLKTAEVNQSDIQLAQSLQNIEDKPIAMQFITGQQASVERNAQLARALKVSEIGILNARAIGRQGDVALALDTAKQAVEAKFAPQKELLTAYQDQLKAIEPLLNAEEKKRAFEQDVRVKSAFAQLESQQKSQEELQKLIINAAGQGAPQNLQLAASKAKSPMEAATILGQYAGDYRKNLLLDAQLKTELAQASKINSDAKVNRDKLAFDKTQATTPTGVTINADGTTSVTAQPIAYTKSVDATTQRQFQDQYSATQSITKELNAYKDLIKQYGNVEVLPTEGRELLAGKKAVITGLVKDALQLGTLDTGVLTLVDQLVGKTGFSNALIPTSSTIKKIDNLNKTFNDNLDNKAKTIGAVLDNSQRAQISSNDDATASYYNTVSKAFNNVNQTTTTPMASDYLNSLTQ